MNLYFYIVMCILIFWATQPAGGTWDTAAWPATDTDKFRRGYPRYSNIAESANERTIATGVGGAPAPTNSYRSPWDVLDDSKRDIRIQLEAGVWVNTNDLEDGSGFTDMTNLPIWTVSNLCIQLEIPTNYFTYTPYRYLNGYGWNTNGVGSASKPSFPYGWTNNDTAAGGSNFPSSRTEWYTTDYGQEEWRRIIAELVYSAQTGAWYWTTNNGFVVGHAGTGSSTNTRAEAESNAEALSSPLVLATDQFTEAPHSYLASWTNYTGASNDVILYRNRHYVRNASYVGLIALGTNVSRSQEYYLKLDRDDIPQSPTDLTGLVTNNNFNVLDTPVTDSNIWYQWSSQSNVLATNSSSTNLFDYTNFPAAGWPGGNEDQWGWKVQENNASNIGHVMLFKWDFIYTEVTP